MQRISLSRVAVVAWLVVNGSYAFHIAAGKRAYVPTIGSSLPQHTPRRFPTKIPAQPDREPSLVLSNLSTETTNQEEAESPQKGKTESAASSSTEEQSSIEEQSLRPGVVLRFLAPTLALWIAPPIMSLIDTAVVGSQRDAIELAALAPGCTLIDSSAYLFMFLATAATNLVATARANGDDKDAKRAIGQALFLALVAGVMLSIVTLVFGQGLLTAIAGRQSLDVVPAALSYTNLRAIAQPAVLAATVLRAAALAEKDTFGPLVSVGVAFALNTLGTLLLVKRMGIRGAAVGTVMADFLSCAFLVARRLQMTTSATEKQLSRKGSKLQLRFPTVPLIVVPKWLEFKRFLKFAAPIFFTILGKSIVYNGVGISVGRFGPTDLAAHQVLQRCFFFWTPVGDSVGMTCQVFLPAIIEREKQTRTPNVGSKRFLFGVGVTAGICAGALAGYIPSRCAAFFTKDMAVVTSLRETAPILATSVAMHGTALTMEGMLLALQDLTFLSCSYVTTTFAAVAWLLGPFRPGNLSACWWILALFQASRACQFSIRTAVVSGRHRAQFRQK